MAAGRLCTAQHTVHYGLYNESVKLHNAVHRGRWMEGGNETAQAWKGCLLQPI